MPILSIHYKNIFHSWRETLALLSPAIFYKIILISLKNTACAAKSICFNILPLFISILYFIQFEQFFAMTFYGILSYIITGALWDYYSFLALRPSVLPKNNTYFFKYSSNLFSYWIINILFRSIFCLIIGISVSYTSYKYFFEGNKILYITIPSIILLKAIQEIGTLFTEDNGPKIGKLVIYQTLLFILYQLPLVILWYMLIFFIEFLNFIFIFQILGLHDSAISNTLVFIIFYKTILILSFLLCLFLRSCITSIYIKRIHEKAGIYL